MDADSIKSEMVKVDWEVLRHGSVDEAWRAFKGILNNLRDRFVPLRL